IIEDWNSDDEDDVSEVNTVSPVKTNETQTVKTQVDKIGQISQKEGIGFKKIKACFVCLINLVRPNGKRAVHTVSIASTARPVGTARPFAPKIAQTGSTIRQIYPRMDNVRPRASYSPIKRFYYTKPAFRPKNLKQDVKTSGVKNMTTTRKRAVVNTGKGKMDNALKKSRWVWKPKGNYMDHVSKESGSFMLKKFEYADPKGISKSVVAWDHAVVDSGCSSHMTGNKAYLLDYEDYNGGFVAFGSDPKGGKITGKAAQEKPSENFPEDNDVQDSKDVTKKEEHTLTEAEQALKDDLERMIAQEIAAKAMNDATRQAFEEEKKRAAQTTSINKLNTGRTSVSTSNSPLVSTANTPYASAASTPTGANTGGSSFVYLGRQIPINALTLPNADLPIDPNMPELEDDSDVFDCIRASQHVCCLDSPFELEAFSDSDYGGASLDRKSTTGGCQFLGRRLISWQCKKQTIVANSTIKAKYVVAANCCGQVLWIHNQMMDYGFNFMNTKIHIDNESTICIVKNHVYHSRTKHIEIRHHFIRDCYEKILIDVIKIHTDANVADLLTKGFDVTRFNFLVLELILIRTSMDLRMDGSCAGSFLISGLYSNKHNMVAFLKKPTESVGFTEIVDFLKGTSLRYALTHNPTIYDSLVKQFWQTATVRTLANGIQELVASIDNKEYTITEASIRSQLQLADATCITNLPDAEIYEGLATLGYVSEGKLTFWKKNFTPQWKFIIHNILHCISPKSGGWDQFGSTIATALICLSSNRVYNFSKMIFDGMVHNLESNTKFLMYPRFLQIILDITTENNGKYLAPTLTKKIFGNMKRGFAGEHVPLLPAMLAGAALDQDEGSAIPAGSQPTLDPGTKIPQSQGPTVISVADEATTTCVEVETEGAATTTTGLDAGLDSGNIHESPLRSHKAPLPEGNTSGSVVDSLNLKELMDVVPKLVLRINNLEKELQQTKSTYGKAVLTLVERVKLLEASLKRKSMKVILSESEDEETEDQVRKIQDIDDDPLVSLVRNSIEEKEADFVTPKKVSASGEAQEEDISPTTLEAAKTLSKVASQNVSM
ncbi:hypothetical protein Tco_1009579, partial [Tanacetum coccineum]